MDDNQLMVAYYGGDLEALGELQRRHWDALLAHLIVQYRLTYHDAEDFVAFAFVRVARTRTSPTTRFNPAHGQFGAWLRRIVHNLILDDWRSPARQEPVAQEALGVFEAQEGREADPSEEAQANELWAAIEDCLQRLRPELREALTLRMEGFANPQIAERLSLLEATVGTRVYHARQNMKGCLEAKGHRIG